jgi:hypothetical protein
MGNTQDKSEGKTGGPTEVFGKYINPNLAGVWDPGGRVL